MKIRLPKTFRNKFNPRTHIMKRIWLSTASIALASLLFIGIITQLFFNHYILRSALVRAQTNQLYTANALEDTLSHILRRFIEICGTEDFRDQLATIRQANPDQSASLNNALQDTLHELSVTSPLIDSVLITSRRGFVFRSSSLNLKQGFRGYTLGFEEDQISGITILPRISSPFSYGKDVIPFAFPIHLESSGNFASISKSAVDSEIILYLFFQADNLSNYLSAYSNDDTEGTLYLMTKTGQFISPSGSALNDEQSMPTTASIQKILQGGSSGYFYQNGNYFIFEEISKRELYLVNVVSRHKLTGTIDGIRNLLLLVAGISVVLISLMTRFSAVYVTKPLEKLMRSVRSIENGTYDSSQLLPQKDEIGQLSAAIDSMYQTIQQQITEITEERQAKYNAEIRLFSEQINPHFLYNTLEYINMEVYSHHAENASLMIQSLGDFLRIGLSFGSETIPVSKELEHVRAYINIMNHRFNRSIALTCEVDPGLEDYSILKIILQPLVENSIRHGFLMDSSGSFIAFPSIDIHVHKEDTLLFLDVNDNGVGIDIERALQIMKTGQDEVRHHVGLNNVYQRLILFYGKEADITLSSVPYYKNTVRIQIPLSDKNERNDL